MPRKGIKMNKSVLQRGIIIILCSCILFSICPVYAFAAENQKERVVNLNSPQHRMHDEFVAFEKMVATKDFDSVAKQLEHSRQVMKVLDQASKAL